MVLTILPGNKTAAIKLPGILLWRLVRGVLFDGYSLLSFSGNQDPLFTGSLNYICHSPVIPHHTP